MNASWLVLKHSNGSLVGATVIAQCAEREDAGNRAIDEKAKAPAWELTIAKVVSHVVEAAVPFEVKEI